MERSARRWRRLLWEEVGGESILEVGVGTGKNMPYYPEGPKITAIDLSAKMLQRARRRAKREGVRVELRQMDAQALDFPDESFDTVVATFVFCSVPNPVQGLQELGRVAKPSGKILLLEHIRPERPWLGWFFDRLNPLVHRLFGFNINRRTLENIERAGLKLERAQDLDRLGIFKLVLARPGSASDSTSNNKGLYRCPECGLEYKEKEWAEECERWCKQHKSCNAEIIKHAVERR